MRIPTPEDFRALETWGLIERPMAAIDDYSEERDQLRWENTRHKQAYDSTTENQSAAFIDDSQQYYRSLERPIDRTKWAFLKRRKAWFHPPLEWGRFAAPGTSRILDLGCGDGDQTQRIAEFIAGRWTSAGFDGFPMEIVGVDINDSRIENARAHAESPHDKLTLQFIHADAVDGTEFTDDYFDYTTMMGVLEVLDDEDLHSVLDEVDRLTAKGVYIRDLLDEYPGMYPRPELPTFLAEPDFEIVQKEKVFEEPFVEEGSSDPLEVWPMNVHHVLFARRHDTVPPEDRY
ncbi:class I SAM-dependent methyltransferase [Natrialbaceae archaeon A-CW1-1]